MSSVILLAGFSAWALLAAAASKPLTRPKRVAASITATFSAPVPLPCTTGTSYAATCPGSSGACSCITFSGNATGGLGRGPVTGAITVDNFDATPKEGCAPIFGSLIVTDTRGNSTITMDISGALCDAIVPAGSKTIGAGFDFNPATVGLSGTGSISGTIDSSRNAKLKLIGAIAPAATPMATASPTATATP